MSKLFANHPDEGLLLRYIDGELPSRRARQVEKHLEACWQCRTGIEELKATVADCIRYRKNVLGAHLPPPPNPWQDLSRGFSDIDSSLSAESSWKRLFRVPPSLRWSVAAAAAIAVLCGVYYELRETPSVQAASLLQRAVIASANQPAKVAHRVRFRSGSQQFVRAAVVGKSPEALPQTLEIQFQQAHYDSQDPLSARAFQSWRDTQSAKKDEVSTVPDPRTHEGNCYRIRTSTTEGDVAAATLMLRTSDLMPVEGLLEFRDSQWIEFSELPDSPDRSASVSAPGVEFPGRPAVPPSRLAAVPPRPSVSVSDELQVLSALHQIGADLGDPIQITRSADKIVVSGIGVTPQRKELIQRTLESMPNVAVEFTEPVAAPMPEGSPSTEAAPSGSVRASAPGNKIQGRLEERLGGRAELERFTSQILDVDEAIMARAYALNKLFQRFPVSSEAQLTPENRRVLREMAREHARALASTAGSLQRALGPMLVSLGGSSRRAAVAHADSWQDSADEVVRASRRVQVLISVLLGVAPGQASADLPADVLTAIAELRANLDQCQQLLAQEGGG